MSCIKLKDGESVAQMVARRTNNRNVVGSSLRLSALMDSDLAWVNGKSGR